MAYVLCGEGTITFEKFISIWNARGVSAGHFKLSTFSNIEQNTNTKAAFDLIWFDLIGWHYDEWFVAIVVWKKKTKHFINMTNENWLKSIIVVIYSIYHFHTIFFYNNLFWFCFVVFFIFFRTISTQISEKLYRLIDSEVNNIVSTNQIMEFLSNLTNAR